jgi:PAS domain-containing protein
VLQPRPDLLVDLRRREAVVDGRAARLTPLELALLRVLAGEPGRVFARDELAARLALRRQVSGSRAVDNLVVRLRRKLDDPPRAPVFIEAVWGVGYRLRDGPSVRPQPAAAGAVAFEALPVPAFVMDTARRMLLLNAAARRLWGVDHARAAGLPCAEVVGCHTRSAPTLAERCPAMRVLARRTPVRCTYLARAGGRGEYRGETIYAPLVDARGLVGVVAVHSPHGDPARGRRP